MFTYIVQFEVHRDCQVREMVYICDANNAEAATKAAKLQWYDSNKSHMFHVHATRSQYQNPELHAVTSWKGTRILGLDVFDKFICTNIRTWRINGRNLY